MTPGGWYGVGPPAPARQIPGAWRADRECPRVRYPYPRDSV